MKNIKRIIFGLLSSLFLATGMIRAAEYLEPMNNDLGRPVQKAMAATENTVIFLTNFR